MDVPEGGDWRDFLDPGSMEVLAGARLEPSLAAAAPGAPFQFERLGYFVADPDGRTGSPVFNRTVGLKDSWAKVDK
jgi:glutaminyl-tRNA synthetase